jgi:hypothetical protein
MDKNVKTHRSTLIEKTRTTIKTSGPVQDRQAGPGWGDGDKTCWAADRADKHWPSRPCGAAAVWELEGDAGGVRENNRVI